MERCSLESSAVGAACVNPEARSRGQARCLGFLMALKQSPKPGHHLGPPPCQTLPTLNLPDCLIHPLMYK